MEKIVVIIFLVWLFNRISKLDFFQKLVTRHSADNHYKKELEPEWKAEREELARQWKVEAESLKQSSQ